jgi:hypothetical protein
LNDEARLRAALLAGHPKIDEWEDQDLVASATIRMERVLAAADAVMFSDESVSRSYPFVYSFLKRRGMVPRGKEVNSLVGYVVTGLRGGYDVG